MWWTAQVNHTRRQVLFNDHVSTVDQKLAEPLGEQFGVCLRSDADTWLLKDSRCVFLTPQHRE